MEEGLTTIPFYTEDGKQVDFYVLEQTTLQGVDYLLVTDDLDEDSEEATVMIMKMTKSEDDSEFALYEFVEDENELSCVAKIFSELMEDVDFDMDSSEE